MMLKKVIATSGFFVALLATSPAFASGDVVICNQSSSEMHISVAAQWSLRILTGNWVLWGPYKVPANGCRTLFSDNASRFHIYLGVKTKGWFGGSSEYTPDYKSSHKFAYDASLSLCTSDDNFDYDGTLERLAVCAPGYTLQKFSVYLEILAQPLNQHDDKVIFLW